jgi:hypothetical protein
VSADNVNEGIDEIDGCDFHKAGIDLVVKLFAAIYTLEQRVEALEHRLDRERVDRAA